MVDRVNVQSGKTWTKRPNGTGPFKLKQWVEDELLILERNDLYYRGVPKLAHVVYRLFAGRGLTLYEEGEIDITGVGLANIDRVLDPADSLNRELLVTSGLKFDLFTGYLAFNPNIPPFDDPKVRQALNYAINRQEIATLVLADLVTPAKGILPPGFPAFNANLKGYEYNPEKARQLLRESKYGDDLENFPPIILTVSGGFGASVGLDLEVITESWSTELGIEVEFQQTEFATYLQDLHKRRFQMFEIAWIADYPDPENFLDILFYSESSNNNTQYSNPEVDQLLLQARTETDQAKRYQLYQQAEEIIVDEAPWIPLWHSGEQYVLVKPRVKDYYLTQLVVPRFRFVRLTN